jgi:predicted short-subunit dehydrogenase-like oxidoreductase (DUF2520 family)
MTQPPPPVIGFIGAGRLARCLAQRFALAGYAVACVASRSPASAQTLAAAVRDTTASDCVAVDDAQRVAETADLIFLTTPDDSLATVAASLRFAPKRAARQALVHCSGATALDVLAPAQDQGVAIGGFHPLYLFGGGPADLQRIEGCSVTLEAEGALAETLAGLVEALGCHPLTIPAGGRLLYHAAANYAASFALCGLAECVELWRSLGFDEQAALRALLPMLSGTLETARDKGLAGALSGPVSRGDLGIVARQLDLLEARGADHAALYALLTRRAVALARRRANPPPALDALDATVDASLARANLSAPTRDQP